MTTFDWIGIGLVLGVYSVVVILLKNVRSFGQFAKKRDADVEMYKMIHQREIQLLEDNIMTFRQLIRARMEVELLKKRDSA